MKKPIKPRILYLLTRFSLRRFEIFDGRKDTPAIPQDTDKQPIIPTGDSWRKRLEKATDEQEKKRHHGKGH